MSLPPGQLFVAQRVCKNWSDVILRSKGIRQICFLEPAGDPVSSSHYVDYGNTSFKLNPLLHFEAMDSEMDFDGFTYSFSFMFKAGGETRSKGTNRDILLTQPPCTTVEVMGFMLGDKRVPIAPAGTGIKATSRFEPIFLTEGPLDLYYSENGVRIGDLMDWVAERASAVTGKESVTVQFEATISTQSALMTSG